MVRGRRQDPSAKPSRQLEISRAFRERRAQEVHTLRETVARLEEEKRLLEKDNACLLDELRQEPASGKEERRGYAGTAMTIPTMEKRVSGPVYSYTRQRSLSPSCSKCERLQAEVDRLSRTARQGYGRAELIEDADRRHADLPPIKRVHVECYPVGQKPSPTVKRNCRPPDLPSPMPSLTVNESIGSNASTDTDAGRQSLSLPPISSFSTASNTPPSSAPRLPQPNEPEAIRMWERSVRESGGDPTRCCAGFFECDEQGHIQVDSPPRVT